MLFPFKLLLLLLSLLLETLMLYLCLSALDGLRLCFQRLLQLQISSQLLLVKQLLRLTLPIFKLLKLLSLAQVQRRLLCLQLLVLHAQLKLILLLLPLQ